jgi:hypothetical protein
MASSMTERATTMLGREAGEGPATSGDECASRNFPRGNSGSPRRRRAGHEAPAPYRAKIVPAGPEAEAEAERARGRLANLNHGLPASCAHHL